MGYLVFSGSTMEKGEGLLYRGFFGVPAFLLSLAKLRSFLLFFLDFFFFKLCKYFFFGGGRRGLLVFAFLLWFCDSGSWLEGGGYPCFFFSRFFAIYLSLGRVFFWGVCSGSKCTQHTLLSSRHFRLFFVFFGVCPSEARFYRSEVGVEARDGRMGTDSILGYSIHTHTLLSFLFFVRMTCFYCFGFSCFVFRGDGILTGCCC